MRIVFSRKGFDSQYGQVASPILPDGTMVSVPIPSAGDPHVLGHLHVDGVDLPRILRDLTRGRINAETPIHLDPDIDATIVARPQGWRPAFGQIGAAQSHLQNQGVRPGDLFLYFGWFRQVMNAAGQWRFAPDGPDIHAIFGWLQVGECIAIGREAHAAIARHPWLADHPHVVGADRYSSDNNTIYVGSHELLLNQRATGLPGAGVFRTLRNDLRLTAPGARGRSTWQLPGWFMPTDGRPPLTYHQSQSRWRKNGASVRLQTVAKGQEFVIDTKHYPEAMPWLHDLLQLPR